MVLSLRRFFRAKAGFSLLEMIIVLGIVGTLLTIIFTRISSSSEKAKISEANIRCKNIQSALLSYQMDIGSYPATAQGLGALIENPGVNGWQGPYIDKDSLNDPWTHPFTYSLGAEGIELTSNGPDGLPGTADDLHFLNGKLTSQKGAPENKE